MKTECILWQGYKLKGGYGRLTYKNKQVLAHRHFYEQAKGKIQEGLTLDHLCNVPSCINVEHLEPVTLRENLLRGRTGLNLLKTHCPSGHAYDEVNTYLYKGKWRRCRICVRKAGVQHRLNKAKENINNG